MKMFYIIGVMVFTISLVKGEELQEIQKSKAQMLSSLEDLNGSTKKTIETIVYGDFNLHAYRENYFLPSSYRYDGKDYLQNGTHDTQSLETEFQLSIRYDFSSNLLGLGEIYSFGYTQRSWWQLYQSSAFFRESNYQPEFFVKIPTYRTFLRSTPIKGFKFASIHQSNGRGGIYERSWNRLSLSTFFQYKNIISELEMWYRTPDTRDYNPQLLDYLGHGELSIMVPYEAHLFKCKIRTNPSTGKGAIEMTYSHPLPAREENDLFFYLKTFDGYGESLIDYNHHVRKVSIGLGISR